MSLRSYAEALGDRIGNRVVDDMVASGEMDRVVREAMATEFERCARDPKYAHAAKKLLAMAQRARNP